jgi:hypothetical protein
MTIKGKTFNFSYVTILEPEKCTCEIIGGMQSGTKRTSQWEFVHDEPDEFVEVSDLRSLGWLIILFWLLVSIAAFSKGHGRLDVALFGAPFCLIPFGLFMIFGRRERSHAVFRYLNGNEAFLIPQHSWQSREVREYIQINLEANKTLHPTAGNAPV